MQISLVMIESAFNTTHRIRFLAATLPSRDEAALWLGAMRQAVRIPDTIPDIRAIAPINNALLRDAAARLNEPEPVLETQS